MPKFAANVSTMYQELAVPDRFKAAAAHGFRAIEFLNPYRFAIEDIQRWLDANQLELILINTLPGRDREPTTGLAAIPGREADFRHIFGQAHEYAKNLGANMIHVLAGVTASYPSQDVKKTLQENLTWAADLAEQADITLMLEPLNLQDVPGYIYSSSDEVVALIKDLGRENIKLQYDFYHMQIMEGHLANHLEQHLPFIGHVQFSSLPGRHEPQFGEVNVHWLFDHLDNLGYAGWIGCEYSAKTTTEEGLSWARPYGLG